MLADIITIGDEILIGQIVNTNSTWLAEQLEAIGIKIRQITTVSDNRQHIIQTLQEAEEQSQLIVITGGLGPTEDDITKQTLAEFFDTQLIENQEVLADIEAFVKSRNAQMNSRNRKQAELPQSCTIIRNEIGTAAGMWFERNSVVFVSMPGVPFEMKAMFSNSVIPKLKAQFKTPEVIHFTVQTFGTPESVLAEQLEEWESALPSEIKLAYLPSPERLRLRMSMVCADKESGEQLIAEQYLKLKEILGETIYDTSDNYLYETVGKLLLERNLSLSTAESCTGGNIARLISSVAGSSEYFKGSVVAYSNEIKKNILGVPEQILIQHGAVSEQTVIEMSKGVQKLMDTDFSIAVSGIAGPGGATQDKPVGTTWIAVANKQKVVASKFIFGTQRDINIRRATATALNMLRLLMIEKL